MVQNLLPLIPNHKTYIEPFGGAAWLLFGKEPSWKEVYNDIDPFLTDFFRVLQTPSEFNYFIKKLNATPYSHEIFDFCRDTYGEVAERAERVYRWYIVMRMCFGAKLERRPTWGYSPTENQAEYFINNKLLLLEAKDRVESVVIHNGSWDTVLEKYDSTDSFFYLDPPYVPITRRTGGYLYEMNSDGHQRLIDLIRNLKGKVIISGYDNEIYERLGWLKRNYSTVCNLVGRTRESGLVGEGHVTKNQARTECVWANYTIQLDLF